MARHTSTTRWGSAALAAATLVLVAGCGSAPAPSGGTIVKPAGGSSPSATTTRTTSGSGTAAGKLGRNSLFAATYAAAMKAGSAHVSMRMGGAASITSVGDVTYTPSNPSMKLSMTYPQVNGAIQMRLVDHVIYMQIPGATPPGKFIAIDPRDTSSPLGKAFGGLSGQMDPLNSLRSMQGAVTSVRLVGSEQVQGVPTDRYHLVVDTAKAMSALKSQLPQGSAASVPPTIEYDVWVDHQNLMRRLEFGVATTTVTMDLSRWGTPVHVTKPPASAIVKQPGA